jgi:putative AlgH/UPF0301 family transcriptional regulator
MRNPRPLPPFPPRTSSRSWTALKGEGRRYEDYDIDDYEDDDEDIDIYDENFVNDQDGDEDDVDWRSFRAHLVSIYDQNTTITSNDFDNIKDKQTYEHTNTNSWIYETGSAIETGTILLHRIDNTEDDDESSGYGLARQYLHKSVVLILEHEDNEHSVSTKGIILNRPTDLIIHEQYEEGGHNEFPIWFGGFDWGIHTSKPKFFCLHSIKSAIAKKVSVQVMNGIYFTTIQNAKDLIADGYAKTKDFWFFSGLVEWEEGELFDEIQDGIWYSVATDASIVRKGLKILTDEGAMDVESAGMQTWEMLMDLVHEKINEVNDELVLSTNSRASVSRESTKSFDDLMFEQWAKKHLRFTEAPLFLREILQENGKDNRPDVIDSVHNIAPGTLIRGSPSGNPFLLSEQEYHKSLILIVQDDQEISVGLILNHPTSRSFDVSLLDESTIFPKINSIRLPVRFGGCHGGPTIRDFGDDRKDDKPLFILYMNEALRNAKVGKPIGKTKDGIWSCTAEDCITAIANHLASPNDFMCIDGFCLWSKETDESGMVKGGILAEVVKGDFEIVPHARIQAAWDSLLQQELLSYDALDRNLDLAQSAWNIADQNGRHGSVGKKVSVAEDKALQLNDEALKRWITINLNNF